MVGSHDVRTIYEDDFLLVLDKPPSLVVDRSETQQGSTLEDWLKQNYDTLEYHSKNLPVRMGIVHRLDKDTSGLLLVAKTPKALENLQAQFKQRKIKKEYLALVHGWVEKGGVVDAAIARNPGNREKFTVIPGISTSKESKPTFEVSFAREAVTEYEPVSNFEFRISNFETIFKDFNKIQIRKLQKMNYGKLTLLRCFPLTGRTHQIRVHLKYIGHPVVSDEKYGGRKVYRLDKRWCPRMFLHAAKLGFYHPVSGEWMEVESPLPEDLNKSLKLLKS